MSRIALITIPVADQRRSKQFYTEVLGFKLIRDEPMGPDQRWIQLAPSEGTTAITLATWFEKMPPGGVQGIVLETSNIKKDHDALAGRGLAISKIAVEPWGVYATFDDLDGNGWVLKEALPT